MISVSDPRRECACSQFDMHVISEQAPVARRPAIKPGARFSEVLGLTRSVDAFRQLPEVLVTVPGLDYSEILCSPSKGGV